MTADAQQVERWPLAIYGPKAGKIHRPRNEAGYLMQADQTVAQAACGTNLRVVYRAESVYKWLRHTPWLLCAKCWRTQLAATDTAADRSAR